MLKRTLFAVVMLASALGMIATVHDMETVRTKVAARSFVATLNATPASVAVVAEDDGVEWREAETSLTAKGVRTMKGYRDGRMCAVVSDLGGKVMGWYRSDARRKAFQIRTDADGMVSFVNTEGNRKHVDDVTLDEGVAFNPMRRAASTQTSAMTGQPLTRNDGIVRHYRAVFPVSDYVFRRSYYSDVDMVYAEWASLETFLNELYMPALGIHFTVVTDDRLIDRDDTFAIDGLKYSLACQRSKELVPTLIDVNSYDCGLTLCNPSEALGACSLSAYLNTSGKVAGCSIDSYYTIAHEMGHGFGAAHTFAGSVGVMSNFVEPGAGQSLMSYGTPQDFFSMVSIYEIQHMIVDRLRYYTDETRTTTAGSNEGQTSNYPVGYQSANRAPTIDTLATLLRPRYTIPNNTNVGLNIVATDPDGDALTYFIQGADYQTDSYHPVSPVHPTYQGVKTPFVGFQPRYTYSWFDRKFVQAEYSSMQVTPGTYHYWVGVSDEKPFDDQWQTAPHATAYDLYEMAVTVVDGTPFRITSKTADAYSFGDKVKLTWGVDPQVFGAESRVRISLSDDFGRTYKWTLRESAPNNGSCEVILPHEAVGMTSYDGSKTFRGGVIKVEEIGGICYALTHESPVYDGENYQMMTGGFTLSQGDIVFSGTPERHIHVTSDNIPAPANVTATASGTSLAVSYSETWQSAWVLSRVWTATNGSKTASYEQIVVLADKAASEVERIELDQTEMELVMGKTARISAVVYPLEITNRRVVWSSSDQAVATIDSDGIITGVGEGTATITASAANGVTATCTLTVLDDSDYRPNKYATLGFTTPGAGFHIDVENVESGKTFNAFAFGICNTDTKPFSGYVGVAIVSAAGKLKTVLSEKYTYLADNDFGYPDFTNLYVYGVNIEQGDEVRIVARSSEETAWRPLPSREGFPAVAPARGNVLATSNIVYDLHPASLTVSGICYNTTQKLPVLGSQYVFTVSNIPSGAKVRYYVDGEETLYRSIQPVWKEQHTIKVLALTDADMIDDAYVYVTTPGTLGALLEASDYDLYFIRSLKVEGKINGADLEFLKDDRLSNLEHLDIYETEIVESSYGGAGEMHARALSGTGLKTLALPKGLVTLGNGCLSRTSLTEIDIPASISYFSLNVFNSSSALTKVVMRNPEPLHINWCVFEYTGRAFGTLYVPKGSKSDFESTDQWNQWGTIVEIEDMDALPVAGRLTDIQPVPPSEDKPVVVTDLSALSTTKVYTLKSRNYGGYLKGNDADGKLLCEATTQPADNNFRWQIYKEGDNYVLRNAGKGTYVTNTSSAASAESWTMTDNALYVYNTLTKVTADGNTYFTIQNADQTAAQSYLHINGSSKAVNWGADADASHFVLEEVGKCADYAGTIATELKADAKAELHRLVTIAYEQDAPTNAVGYYTAATFGSVAEVRAAAKAIDDNSSATPTEMVAQVRILAPRVEALECILPTAGSFYRLKGAVSGKYATADPSPATGAAMVAEADANTIFYLDDTNALVNYTQGVYMKETSQAGTPGETAKDAYSFTHHTDGVPYLYVHAEHTSGNGKWLYDHGANGYLNRNDAVHQNTKWTVEAVEAIPVTISALKYASVNLPVATIIPNGVEAWVAGAESEGKLSISRIKDNVLPANCAVLLYTANPGTYQFLVTDATATIANTFSGTVAAEVTPDNVMVLGNDPTAGVGLYSCSAAYIPGFKMYYETASSEVRIELPEIAAAIEAAKRSEMADGVTYNLNGQQVTKANGVVIVNGRKIVVR